MDAALIVLDGWGLGTDSDRDAIRAADTPNFDHFRSIGAYGTLEVSGRRVGLPDGQMGNSEVGHLNIGAGSVVLQELTRINDAIRDGTFRTNDVLNDAFARTAATDGTMHFIGLVSDGGVHSNQIHLHELIRMASECDIEAQTHVFTDGRDTDPRAGIGFIQKLENHINSCGTGAIASVSGRYYAMDRDERWDRTFRVYKAMVDRDARFTASSGERAVIQAYEREETDEFIQPSLVKGGTPISTDDVVICFNFRADRMRQLVRMLGDFRPTWPIKTEPPHIHIVTMTQYDETFDLQVAFPPEKPRETLGSVLSAHEKTQLRIAETEKYAHVTYFLNGGREVEFSGERRQIVPSPDVATYDEQPAMSAVEVTDSAIECIESTDPDVLVLNYANPDMVGHTGDYEATIIAVETVDDQLGRLVRAIRNAGGHVIITADHGNADDMGAPEEPHTAHTTNDVPFIYLPPTGNATDYDVRISGTLADIAPTLLSLLGIPRPSTMTGEPLLIRR